MIREEKERKHKEEEDIKRQAEQEIKQRQLEQGNLSHILFFNT